MKQKSQKTFLKLFQEVIRLPLVLASAGFTLIEMLVAVMIIGILAAVAVPQYQKAVLKSRFTSMMPVAKTIAGANEVYYAEHDRYATDPAKLNVTRPANTPDGTTIELGPTSEYAYVLATNNLARNNYIVYQKNSGKFADNIHCEAVEKDTRANEVCTSLGGQLIPGSLTDGYVTYVLSGNPGTDKLPSSLTKLAKTVCGEDTNCTAHVEGNTVVSESCTGNENTTVGKTCINKTYDDTGAQVDYERSEQKCTQGGSYPTYNTTCTTNHFDDQNTKTSTEVTSCYTSYATWDNGECTPKSAATSYPGYYNVTTTEGDNKTIVNKYCSQFEDGKCTAEGANVSKAILVGNAVKSQSSDMVYCNGSWNSDNTCNDGEWNSTTRQTYNDQGKETSYIVCNGTWLTSKGVCTKAGPGSSWKVYDNAGTTLTQRISMQHADYPATKVTFITQDASYNEMGRETCTFANADWTTGTCKPGTAI